MVGAELHLETVVGLALGRVHDACVVDEPVQHGVLRQEIRCKLPHRIELCQVELSHLNLRGRHPLQHLGPRPLTLRGAPRCEHHERPLLGELLDRHQPDARVAARDDNRPTGEVLRKERRVTHEGLGHGALRVGGERRNRAERFGRGRPVVKGVTVIQKRLRGPRGIELPAASPRKGGEGRAARNPARPARRGPTACRAGLRRAPGAWWSRCD